jgi:hypothetical protein
MSKAPYINRRRALRPYLHGLMVHITWWAMFERQVHAHRCTRCQHVIVCTCTTKDKLNLVRCLWCQPWAMIFRRPRKKGQKAHRNGRVTV